MTPAPDKTTVETVKVGGAFVGRADHEPGVAVAEAIKPIEGTDDCQVMDDAFIGHDDAGLMQLAPGGRGLP